MKNIILTILFIALLSFPVIAATLNVETAAEAIKGRWKLLSVEREGFPVKNYKDQTDIWTFDGQKFRVSSEDLGGEIHDSYRLLRAHFRIRTTIIMLSEKLKKTHLSYGKFVVRSIENDILTLEDWDGTVTYILKRVSD